ncbi:MAG: hypothetical protein H8E44_07350 [Planctomycetes bacterium]|nr:hypothetical protein [Planctomycetota bacterium]MBL7044739.1 hypothetical protein [Pirellulaceae bacterium]
MTIRIPVLLVLTSALISFALLAGCGQSDPEPSVADDGTPSAETGGDDYNPHDVPITEEQKQQLREQVADLPKAVEVLQQLRDAMERETKDGIPENPFEAHQALDKADLVLSWLREIARDSGVPKEHWAEVNTTANDLRNLFEKVHQNVDNKQDPDFASVAGEIDAKIARLREIGQAEPAASGEAQP